jgi:imidazoleglycerol-phosphate dehydratase
MSNFTRADDRPVRCRPGHEFFQGLVNHALMTLHIDNLRGTNAHHQAETVFKAFRPRPAHGGEADPRAAGAIPSTKGSL